MAAVSQIGLLLGIEGHHFDLCSGHRNDQLGNADPGRSGVRFLDVLVLGLTNGASIFMQLYHVNDGVDDVVIAYACCSECFAQGVPSVSKFFLWGVAMPNDAGKENKILVLHSRSKMPRTIGFLSGFRNDYIDRHAVFLGLNWEVDF